MWTNTCRNIDDDDDDDDNDDFLAVCACVRSQATRVASFLLGTLSNHGLPFWLADFGTL